MLFNLFGKQQETDDNAKFVMKQYIQAKEMKEPIKNEWKNYVKLWRGDHWSRKHSYRAQISDNVTNSIIETMIPLMMDRQPVMTYEPHTSDDQVYAKKMTQTAAYIWESDRMQEKMHVMLRDLLILGNAVVEMNWNASKWNGMGEVEANVIDPFHFYPNPEATSQDDMEWCIIRTRMSVMDIKRKYQKDVPSDKEYFDQNENRPTTLYIHSGNLSGTYATVLKKWYRDDAGNVRYCLVTNGVTLEDNETPYEEQQEFPIVIFQNFKLHGEFWATGDIKNIASLQIALNKVHSMIMDNMIATNNTMLVVSSNSGVKTKDLRNEPGLIVEITPGARLDRLPPPALPNHLFNQIELLKKEMEDITGIHDVTKGIASSSVTAASAFQILTENSQTRIRGKMKAIENGIKRIGKWYLILTRQFYTEPRMVRVSGETDQFKFAEFDGRELRKQQQQFDEMGQPMLDENGQPLMITYLTDFDITISSGSSMMLNKSSRYQQYFELYQNGALDIETLLQAAEVEDTKEVIGNLIKYGKIQDPDAPKINVKQVFEDLGIRVNMSSTNPDAIVETILKAQDEVKRVEELTQQQTTGGTFNQQKQAQAMVNEMPKEMVFNMQQQRDIEEQQKELSQNPPTPE